MTELSDLVAKANSERQWSTRQISAAATKAGFRLSHSTVGKVLNGTHGRVDVDTVLALEAVFKIDRDKLTTAAKVPTIGDPYDPPREAVMLSERQRKAVSELILSIVNEEGVMGNAEHPAATSNVIEGPFDQALDDLPSESEDPPPIAGRSTERAARKDDKKK